MMVLVICIPKLMINKILNKLPCNQFACFRTLLVIDCLCAKVGTTFPRRVKRDFIKCFIENKEKKGKERNRITVNDLKEFNLKSIAVRRKRLLWNYRLTDNKKGKALPKRLE